MTDRTSPTALGEAAEDALRAALGQVGLRPEGPRPGEDADLVVILPEADRRLVQVRAAAVPTTGWVSNLPRRERGGPLFVVVGDQISGEVRDALNELEIGWLDRRGHLRFTDRGVFVDTDVLPSPRDGAGRSLRQPIKGRAGLAAAAALLMRPEDPISASETARAARLNPSSITRALQALVASQLAERRPNAKYRPLVPELFWALGDAWAGDRSTLSVSPDDLHDARFGLNAQSVDDPGWALSGERGAVAWGAPLVLTADYPSFFYVPDDRALRTARSLAPGSGPSGVTIAVDPVGLATRHRFGVGVDGLPLAHPLFCALDLSASSRDREALDEWTPPAGFTRVW